LKFGKKRKKDPFEGMKEISSSEFEMRCLEVA
jgi:hypothetical protein